jgi:hypothetical protein
LDDVHQALALDAAKSGLGLAADQGLDGFHEEAHFLIGLRLDPVLIHAQRVGARAKLLVANAGEHDQAKLGIFAARDGEHLQSVHF